MSEQCKCSKNKVNSDDMIAITCLCKGYHKYKIPHPGEQPYWTRIRVDNYCKPGCKGDKGDKGDPGPRGPKGDSCIEVLTEEICGRIRQKCNSKSKTIWRAIGIHPSGTIKITNTSHCIMRLMIKHGQKQRTSTVEIDPKEEMTLTITSMESISVECSDIQENDMCSGCYTLIIHYPCD